ncbi:MAG: A/G-specific adenine glycosylase [Porphyromonas sp.]|nr:A/G-specific adenine glycosylase [Porphyromonas sp.]
MLVREEKGKKIEEKSERATLFRSSLLQWYAENGRDLPWRQTQDPYKIWISEIILQQTQVKQGLSYYLRFVERFPTVRSLAEAPEEEVLHLWEGLGYYSRAHNMITAAGQVCNEKGGIFPSSYRELLSLKGVGAYTAAAIASIAFGEAVAVVDGNVYRVLSRFNGIDTAIDTTAGKKLFAEMAQEYIDKSEPALYNQAIMDFGALQCRPKGALCSDCPIEHECLARKADVVDLLPRKEKKVSVKEESIHYLLCFSKEGELIVRQRDKQGIWKALHELPTLSTEEIPSSKYELLWQTSHQLTHRKLNIRIYTAQETLPDFSSPPFFSIPLHSHRSIAFPKPLREFLDSHFLLSSQTEPK